MKAIIHSSGGADLDVITAAASDVRKGKVIVDRDGNPLTGTMAEKGAATYYGQNYDQVIAANQYLTGNQTIVGDGNLQPWNIKRGVTIFGRAGTFEGWLDLYHNIFLDGNTSGINYNGLYTDYVNVGNTISFKANASQNARKGVAFSSPVSFSSYGRLYVRYSSDVSLTVGVVKQGADYGSWEVSTSDSYSIDSNVREVALDIFGITRRPVVFIGISGYFPTYSASIHRIILGRPL